MTESADQGEDSETESTDGPEKSTSLAGGTVYASMELKELQDEIRRHKETVLDDGQLSESVKASRLQLLSSAGEAVLKITEFNAQRIAYDNQIVHKTCLILQRVLHHLKSGYSFSPYYTLSLS